MDKFQQSILDFFSNKELLRNIRTGSVLGLILLIPLWYFGFRDTLTLEGLITLEFGGAVFIITLSVIIATKETKLRAFDDKFIINTELLEIQRENELQADKIKNIDKRLKQSLDWITAYNENQQEIYNEIKTNERIKIYERRIVSLRIKGKEKKAQHYEKEIESLRENHLFDDKFVPYDLRRLINIEQKTIRIEKKKGNPDISKNPKAISWKSTTIGAIVRGLGIGIFGSIPFVINASLGQVFWFYVSYLFVMIFTVLSQYLLTTYIMDNGYKNGLKTINRMQKELIAYLTKEKALD